LDGHILPENQDAHRKYLWWTIVPRGFLSGLATTTLIASHVFAVRLPLHRRSIQLSFIALVIVIGFALYGQFSKGELLFARHFGLALVPVMLGLVVVLMIFFQDREQSGWATFVLPLSLHDRIDISSTFSAYVSRPARKGIAGVHTHMN